MGDDVAQHLPLGGHVQGGGGLVQQQHRRIPENGPGDGDPLCLPLGQAPAPLAHSGVDAPGHFLHEIPGAGQLQGLDDLLVAGVLLHGAHVFRDGAGEDGVALGHIGEEMACLRVHGHFPAVAGADDGLALLGADQPQNQADHGGFPFAGGAHQGHDLPGLCHKFRLCNHIGALRIGKAQIPHLHGKALFGVLIQLAALRDMYLSGQLHQLPDTVGGDGAVEKGGDDGHQAAEGAGQIAPLLQEQGHGAVGDGVGPQAEQTVAEGGKLHRHADHGHKDVGFDGEHIVIQAHVLEFSLPPAEFFAVIGRDAEGFDGVEIIEGLHLEAHELAVHLLDLLAVLPLFFDEELGDQQHKGGAAQGDEGHDPVVMEDDQKGGREAVDGDDDAGQPADGVAADGGDVAVEAVEHVAVGIAGQGQPVRVHDLVENICLDIVVDIDAQSGGNAAEHAVQGQTDYGASHHDDNENGQLAGLVAGDDINEVLACHAADQAHGGAEDAQEHIEHDGKLIPGAVGEDPLPVVDDLPEGAVLPAGGQCFQ